MNESGYPFVSKEWIVSAHGMEMTPYEVGNAMGKKSKNTYLGN